MQFLHPQLLWLLGIIPLLAWWHGQKGRSSCIEYSSADLIREVARESRAKAGQWMAYLRLLGLALLILAFARPQFVRGTTEIQASGIDIVLALDISGSMEALDFKMHGEAVSRVEVVKSVVSKFITDRPNDRIGLVAFAGRPYLVSPLTLDHSWLLQNLERVKIGIVEDGTAIGSAIATSVNRLRDQPAKSKIVILLTDGVNNAGKVAPETAADAARAMGIKIYTIGAGIQGEAPLPVQDQFGNRRLVLAKVDIDEKTLQKVADITNAKFYRATDTDSLRQIYSQIDKLERSKITMKQYEQRREAFPWFLIPGLLVIGIEFLLSNTRYRRLP